VRRFVEGDVLTYKLKGSNDGWRTEEIERIVVENDIILMPNGMVKIADIDKLRFERHWTAAYEKSMYTFGITWAFWKTVATIFKQDSLTKQDAIIVGAAVGSGFLIRKLFKHKVIKIRGKRRLRVIDLNFRAK
jgi:hypothetical protein